MSKNINSNLMKLTENKQCDYLRISLTLVFKYSFIAALVFIANSMVVFAQQQQWASQYVKWSFEKTIDVWNIDQQVWVPIPNNDSFMPLQWNWKGSQIGGYLGLQQASDIASQNVRFSLWNATEAQGTNCQKFGGEGIGYTCILPIKINPKKMYKYRLWKLEAAKDGQWWGGWLIEVENGKLTEHLIGKIKVSPAFKTVDSSSITNFVEFWGDHINPCGKVPGSVTGFAPPAVNFLGKETGNYEATSKYSGSDRAEGNLCRNGTESDGSLIIANPYNFGFTNGVMMFLGGSNKTPSLDPKIHLTPANIPIN